MRYQISAITLLMMAVAGTAQASDYHEVGYTDDVFTSIDATSVKKRSGQLSAWYLRDYKKPWRVGELSSKVLVRIDCGNEKSGVVSAFAYAGSRGTGNILLTEDLSEHEISMTPAAPGTVGFAMIAAACYIQKHGTIRGLDKTPEKPGVMTCGDAVRAVGAAKTAAGKAAAQANVKPSCEG